ncbi:MAG: sulfurtransferase [Pyrinomonadaceae bacterium]
MTKPKTPIITSKELLESSASENLLIFDASNNPNAKANYEAGHLRGTFLIDVNTELANIKETPADGGRHPLPAVQDFCATLRKFGVSDNSEVVVYDDMKGANAAARFWWMLQAIGFENVRVLEGGFQAAVREGFPVTKEVPVKKMGNLRCDDWNLPLVELTTVIKASETGEMLIIDVREASRFRGETEPFDKIAGHIPNARNIPFTENMDENGRFLPAKELLEKYEEAMDGAISSEVIVHCGSGITACHTILAFEIAGLELPKLYVGSWSEWSNNDLPIIKGSEQAQTSEN